jgi:hypothetical protein
MLFGPSADAPEALTRHIMSAGHVQGLGHALQRLPRVTREAATREATAAAAGLLKLDLMEVLVAGWREHRDIINAARRTLATPGSKELVGLAAHRIHTVQQPAVSILIDGRRVHTLQLGLSIVFEVTGLVAGVSVGRLAGIHAGRCEIGVALTVHEIEVLTKRAHHVELPGVKALKSGFRLLPAGEYPSDEHSAGGHLGSAHPASQFPSVEFLNHELARGQSPASEHDGREHVSSEHVSSEHVGSEHVSSEHAGREHVSSEHAGSEHQGTQLSGGEHPGSQVNGGERPATQISGREHPDRAEEDDPSSSSASVPWWENVESGPSA